jgi:uncharacterized repeat protein (TIGR03803 family)
MRNPAQPSTSILRGRLRTAAVALALICGLTMVVTGPAQAQTLTVLHDFTSGGDGAIPQAGLTMDAAGNFYGTTSSGGYMGSDECRIRNGCGVVFKLTHKPSGWTLVPFYTFQGGIDGNGPLSRVVPGPGGGLYGTTYSGGSQGCSGDTCGTVYRVTPQARVCEKAFCSGTETVLYRFTGGRDGANPTWGDLNFDPSGNVYGTALQGGDNGVGAVFMLSPSHGGWTESTLYSFALETGAYPQSGVIFDSAGNLYGAASNYGLYGYGMIYQLAPSASGWTETTLYSFQGAADGLGPVGGLVFDRTGNLYGTTVAAGAGTGGGTVYKLADLHGSWSFATLYSLVGAYGGPDDSLTMDAAGNLYGTTYEDGAFGYGSVFKLAPQGDGTWLYTDLHDFTPRSDDGRWPVGSVFIDANGNLFGTASGGGDRSYCETTGCGVVWEITP